MLSRIVGVVALAMVWPHAAHAAAFGGSDDSLVDHYRVVAVMPLSTLGSTSEAVQAVQTILLGQMQSLLGSKMVPPSQLDQRGRLARGDFERCDGVVTCLAEVVGALGWDAFVVGNIAGLGENRVINLKLIDARTGEQVRQVSEKASGQEKQLIAQMRKAAVSLLAPNRLVGRIDLQCAQPDVQLTVDGKLVGTTPLKNPHITVPIGRHAVEANGEGLVPFSTFVDVSFGEMQSVAIKLPHNTVFVGGATPFRARWWTWALVGAGAVGVGLGAFFNTQEAANSRSIQHRIHNGTWTADHRDLYTQEQDNWYRALSFYGGGGALLATAGVLLTLDFF